MGLKDRASSSHEGFFNWLVNAFLRFCELVLGLAVVGLYGGYVNDARLAGKYADPNYTFATATGAIGAFFALVLALPFLRLYRAWPLDFCIL
jgi:Ni/Fe-hydrogenase subunit HybB-like protein